MGTLPTPVFICVRTLPSSMPGLLRDRLPQVASAAFYKYRNRLSETVPGTTGSAHLLARCVYYCLLSCTRLAPAGEWLFAAHQSGTDSAQIAYSTSDEVASSLLLFKLRCICSNVADRTSAADTASQLTAAVPSRG
jgi:hypothetical protein